MSHQMSRIVGLNLRFFEIRVFPKIEIYWAVPPNNMPGVGVSVDQLQSAQPGLVPQLSGKLTSSHIWSAQMMVYHLIDLTYIQLMIITK